MTLSTEDPRRAPRSKVLLAATVECRSRTVPVVLRDLSEHGALIETEATLHVDSEVVLRRNDLQVQGFVAWARGSHAGIAFADSLSPEDVLEHIGRPQLRTIEEPVHRRPGFTRPGMSPEERRWADEMMREPVKRGDCG